MKDFPEIAYTAFQVMKNYEDEFEKQDSISDKLKYVEKKLIENNITVDEVVKLWKRSPEIQVNCFKSQELRKEGNKFYKKRQFGEAAQFYR